MEAEIRALKKEKALAVRSYEVAVLLAGRRGLVHLQGLANERFANYLQEVGDSEEARYRYAQAQSLYSDWGATTKVDQMRALKHKV